MEAILTWILRGILSYLVTKAGREAEDRLAQLKRDEELGKISDESSKAYVLARSREERRRLALSLLNRMPFDSEVSSRKPL